MNLEAKQTKLEALYDVENSEIDQSINVPSFKAKSRQSVDYNQITFCTAKDELDESRRLNESKQYKFQLKIASPISKVVANSKSCNNQVNNIKKSNLNFKNNKFYQTNQNLLSTDNTKIYVQSPSNQKYQTDCIPESNYKQIQQYYEQKLKAPQNF
ncbi:hypothetical protein ABPG74_007455 [Tetrahymena malaccensis]